MALHIDTSNVTLMSEFKSAIEDYVENYVQAYVNVTLGGTHKKKLIVVGNLNLVWISPLNYIYLFPAIHRLSVIIGV